MAGVVAWLIPASLATGGMETYLHATVGQFEWRFGRPGASVLASSMGGDYLLSRAAALIGALGQASRQCISPRGMPRGVWASESW